MKKHIVSVIIAAFLAAVSVSFAAEKVAKSLVPSKEYKVQKIEKVGDEFYYEIPVKNNDSSSVRFITDLKGTLTRLSAVVDDHLVAILEFKDGAWNISEPVSNPSQITFDPVVWTDFFAKIQPVRVTDKGDSSHYVDIVKADNGEAILWEMVGYSYDDKLNHLIVLKCTKPNMPLRTVLDNDFAVLPREGQKFALAKIGSQGKYFPVETIAGNENKPLTVVVLK